jgi:hypothetical protein
MMVTPVVRWASSKDEDVEVGYPAGLSGGDCLDGLVSGEDHRERLRHEAIDLTRTGGLLGWLGRSVMGRDVLGTTTLLTRP